MNFKKDDFSDAGIVATSKSAFIYMYFEQKNTTTDNIQTFTLNENQKPVITIT